MASLRQYFETDFSNTLRVRVSVDTKPDRLEAVLHYDLLAHAAFLSCWVPGADLNYDKLAALVVSIKPAASFSTRSMIFRSSDSATVLSVIPSPLGNFMACRQSTGYCGIRSKRRRSTTMLSLHTHTRGNANH